MPTSAALATINAAMVRCDQLKHYAFHSFLLCSIPFAGHVRALPADVGAPRLFLPMYTPPPPFLSQNILVTCGRSTFASILRPACTMRCIRSTITPAKSYALWNNALAGEKKRRERPLQRAGAGSVDVFDPRGIRRHARRTARGGCQRWAGDTFAVFLN